jgi:hypothetical protein
MWDKPQSQSWRLALTFPMETGRSPWCQGVIKTIFLLYYELMKFRDHFIFLFFITCDIKSNLFQWQRKWATYTGQGTGASHLSADEVVLLQAIHHLLTYHVLS